MTLHSIVFENWVVHIIRMTGYSRKMQTSFVHSLLLISNAHSFTSGHLMLHLTYQHIRHFNKCWRFLVPVHLAGSGTDTVRLSVIPFLRVLHQCLSSTICSVAVALTGLQSLQQITNRFKSHSYQIFFPVVFFMKLRFARIIDQSHYWSHKQKAWVLDPPINLLHFFRLQKGIIIYRNSDTSNQSIL